MATKQLFINNASSLLAANITNIATSLAVTATEGGKFPAPATADEYFLITIAVGNSFEVVKCTSRTTDTLTVVRAQEGTVAQGWSSGALIELRYSKTPFTNHENFIYNLQQPTGSSLVNFLQSGTGALSESMQTAERRFPASSQYSSEANYQSAVDTLISSLGPATWRFSNNSSTIGSATGFKYALAEDSTDLTNARNEGAIWSGKSWAFATIAHRISSGSQSTAGAPIAGLFVYQKNSGAAGDGVAIIGDAHAIVNNAVAFGANFIARCETGLTTPKLVGCEIDVEPAVGVIPSTTSGGLFINGFNADIPAPAIQIGGVSSGTFNNGLVIGGLKSTTAAGVSPNGSASMNSLINTGSGVYNTAAIMMSNTHRIRFSGTASAHAFIYNDSSNNVRIVNGGSQTIFRNNADTVSNVAIDDSGNVDIGGVYRKGGTQVLGARSTGWTNQTAVASKADLGASPTVGALASWASAIDAMLKVHGITGT